MRSSIAVGAGAGFVGGLAATLVLWILGIKGTGADDARDRAGLADHRVRQLPAWRSDPGRGRPALISGRRARLPRLARAAPRESAPAGRSSAPRPGRRRR